MLYKSKVTYGYMRIFCPNQSMYGLLEVTGKKIIISYIQSMLAILICNMQEYYQITIVSIPYPIILSLLTPDVLNNNNHAFL